MPVDEDGPRMQVSLAVGERHQRRLVSQAAGIKNSADLPDHVLPLQLSQPRQQVLLCNAHIVGNRPVRFLHYREVALNDVEQLAVGKVHGFRSHFLSLS